MTEFFYKAFENTNYPCYWLGQDGVFWSNHAARAKDTMGGGVEDVRRLLGALASETCWAVEQEEAEEEFWPEHASPTPQALLLQSALQMRGIEVLPHQDGLFAAQHAAEQMPVNAMSGGLRGPVSDILSALQALARRLENSRLEEGDEVFFHECLESIQKNEYYLLRLAYNVELFDLTKAKPATEKTLEMSSFVDSLCKKTKNTFVKQGVELEADITPEVLPVGADSRILGHVIMNLLRNCLCYTKEGNRVNVTLKKVGNRAVLTVRDKGLGIRPEALPHVFTPYYSAQPYLDSEERPGLGLGLALAKNAVWALGGTVAVESVFGEGTSVTLALPLAGVEDLQFGSGDDHNDYFSDSQSPVYIQLCGFCPLPVM